MKYDIYYKYYLVKNLEENIKRFKDSDLNNFTKDYLIANDFYPTFDSLTF